MTPPARALLLVACAVAYLLSAGHAMGAEADTEDRLVFVSLRDAPTTPASGLGIGRRELESELLSIGLTSADIRKLTDPSDASDLAPKASSDGTRVVFERRYGALDGPSDIWIINADGSGLRQLTSTPDIDESMPALSIRRRRASLRGQA